MLARKQRELARESTTPLLPQTFGHGADSQTPRLPALGQIMDEAKEVVKTAAMQVCGMKDTADLSEAPAHGISRFKRKFSIELQDDRAMRESRFDEISLVTIMFVRATGHRDLIVPLVIPHDHPRGYGAQIKNSVDTLYREKYGATPEQLAKSRTVKAVERLERFLRANRRKLVFAGIGAAVSVAGLLVGPPVFNAGRQQYAGWVARREAKREAAFEGLYKELSEVRRIMDAKPINPGDVFKAVTSKHWEAIEARLDSPDADRRANALSMYSFMVPAYARHCKSHEGYSGKIAEIEKKLTDFVKKEDSPALRHQAADTLHELKVASE